MLGVVNDVVPVPPASTTPPDAAAYQSIVSPAPTVADIVTVPVPHLEPFTGAVGAAGAALMVTDEVVLLQFVVPSVKVNVTVPADTPVITPALVTVAMALSLLTHVPPEIGDKVAVLPTHSDGGAVTTGKALTVTDEVVLLQFVAPSVKVNVTIPADTPVITPALVTVAMALSLLTQVPPDVGDKVAVLPTHNEEGAVTTGKAFTVTDEVVLLQFVVPSVKVKVTVPADTPVITPALVTVAMALSLLTHVPPETGDKVAVLPTHIDAGAVTTGGEFTVTMKLHDTVLPQSSVAVQVTVWVPTSKIAPSRDVPVLGFTPASVE